MAGTTISTAVTVGVTLTSQTQNPVTVTSTGQISVTGSYASAIYTYPGIVGTVTNNGTLTAANGYGVRLHWGGSITNGSAGDTTALISGGLYGVRFDVHGPGTLTNFGTVSSGNVAVLALPAASVTNGATNDTVALISGYSDGLDLLGNSTVTNFATIKATGTAGTGVYVRTGGSVTNGSVTDATATITGDEYGVDIGRAAGVVMNYGTITGTSASQGRGVALFSGGSVTNGSSADTTALISAAGPKNGVYIGGALGTLVNFGTVTSAGRTAVSLQVGGTVTNGSTADTSALISGLRAGIYIRADVASAVFNYGTIANSQTHDVINIYASIGNITNGATNDTLALISGPGTGAYLGSGGTVTNYGTITSSQRHAVGLGDGGSVVNGTTADTTALITNTGSTAARSAIYSGVAAATITNYGTISSSQSSALNIEGGGSVTNGTTADTAALIDSTITGSFNTAIYASNDTVTIANFGTIKSASAQALDLNAGGVVTNGSTADTVASLIGIGTGGSSAIQIGGASGTVTNFGIVTASQGIFFDTGTTGSVTNAGTVTGSSGTGIQLNDGGSVTNGSATDKTALIASTSATGGAGIYVGTATGTITNYGTIRTADGAAISLAVGGTVTNGSTADTTAAITANTMSSAVVIKSGTATVTNYGTLTSQYGISFLTGATGTVVNAGKLVSTSGASGSVIGFSAGANRLVVDPGASFVGTVNGPSTTNTLELGGTTAGTFSGIGSQFLGFGTLQVDAGASWTLTGFNAIGVANNLGTLILAAGAGLNLTGAIPGAASGTFELNSGSTLYLSADVGSLDKMKFLGTGDMVIRAAGSFGINVGTTTYRGPLIENFVAGDKIDLSNVLEAGATLTYTPGTTGILQVTDGATKLATLSFQNSTLGAGSFHPGNDGTGHLLITHS